MDKCRWTFLYQDGRYGHYETGCGEYIMATKKAIFNNKFCDDCGKPIEVSDEAKG